MAAPGRGVVRGDKLEGARGGKLEDMDEHHGAFQGTEAEEACLTLFIDQSVQRLVCWFAGWFI